MKDKMQYLSYSVNVWSILMEQIEELLVNGMDTDCDEDIENSPSSIDPYAEKVNDLPDDIHSEDFQLLQVNMDYAITKTLLQIVTQSGDQNFQRVFQKCSLLQKLLDLCVKSAMCLKETTWSKYLILKLQQ